MGYKHHFSFIFIGKYQLNGSILEAYLYTLLILTAVGKLNNCVIPVI